MFRNFVVHPYFSHASCCFFHGFLIHSPFSSFLFPIFRRGDGGFPVFLILSIVFLFFCPARPGPQAGSGGDTSGGPGFPLRGVKVAFPWRGMFVVGSERVAEKESIEQFRCSDRCYVWYCCACFCLCACFFFRACCPCAFRSCAMFSWTFFLGAYFLVPGSSAWLRAVKMCRKSRVSSQEVMPQCVQYKYGAYEVLSLAQLLHLLVSGCFIAL